MRAINTIRAAGGLAQAVSNGVLRQGIMHSCIKHDVDFILAGSIRDDGPLPDVITDSLAAQKAMRSKIEGVTIPAMGWVRVSSSAISLIEARFQIDLVGLSRRI